MPAILPFAPMIASGIGLVGSAIAGHQASQQNAATRRQMQNTQAQQMQLFNQAQQQIPGMQTLIGQYGNANQGFLQGAAGLGALGSQYGPLVEQMQRLYSQDPTSESATYMRSMLNEPDGLLSQMGNIATNAANVRTDDGGAAQALMNNARGVLSDTSSDVYHRQAQLAGNDAMGQLSSQLASRGIASSGAASRLGASTLSRLYADAAARGQQDRLSAYGQSNGALSAAGNMNLQRGAQSLQNANMQAGLLGNVLQARTGLATGLANLGMQGQQQQAALLGQQGNMIGAQQQNLLAQSGLLGNYLQGLQGQYGMQQGIANMYTNQSGVLGGVYNQQAAQINPNPYGGVGASLGAFGNAAAQYTQNQQPGFAAQPVSYPSTGNWGAVNYPGVTPQVPLSVSGGSRYSLWT